MLFHHVSTEEVYGSVGAEGLFTETAPYSPRSPYSASKAASDHLVRAYHHTYDLPITLSNCSNNYGPYQLPEKLTPLMIIDTRLALRRGPRLRHLGDHDARGLLHAGETYNVGGETERRNIDLVRRLCEIVAEETGKPASAYTALIRFWGSSPTARATTNATRSTARSSSAISAGRKRTFSTRACGTPYAGTSSTATGSRASEPANTANGSRRTTPHRGGRNDFFL